MSLTKSFLGLAMLAMGLGVAGNAAAQTCASDQDCPQGTACHGSTVVNPTEPACKPGTDCPKPDASAPMVIMTCEPKPCSVDTDCGAGMVCHSEQSTSCTGGGSVAAPCPANTVCDAGAPTKTEEMCTSTTVRACAYRWQLPCNADSDCGAEFKCMPTVSGACSGGGSTGSGGASRPAPDEPVPPPAMDAGAPPMCTTMTSYPGWCTAKVTSCTTDAECPAPWKCLQSPDTAVSSPPAGFAAPADAGSPAPTKVCASPLAGPLRGGKGGTAEDLPTMGGGNGSHVADGGTTPPTAGSDTSAKASSSGGCSAGSGGRASGLGLVLVALGAFLARRRR
jgi:MYXO-CTERM domain-containing protein